jgi:hypothetical protein
MALIIPAIVAAAIQVKGIFHANAAIITATPHPKGIALLDDHDKTSIKKPTSNIGNAASIISMVDSFSTRK